MNKNLNEVNASEGRITLTTSTAFPTGALKASETY
jgi:hypothetical protein